MSFTRQSPLFAALILVTVAASFGSACSSDDDDAGGDAGSAGSSATGGDGDGSSGEGGSSASGTGGTSSGGTSSGGSSSGGTSSGGSSSGGTSSGGTSAGGTSSGGTSAGGAAGAGACGSTQCTNCIDDDQDGMIDSADPECTGPADNAENSFATGIPGDNIDFCQDCFFDGNSGHGDDDCQYHTDCLSGTDPGGPSDCFDCDVSQTCKNFCMPYTPNGCDCFGCCQVPLPGGGTKSVILSQTCTLDVIDDPTKCVPCTQSADCKNDCGHCELCVGKTELPDDCTPVGTGGTGGTGGSGGSTGGSGGSGGSCVTPVCPGEIQPCGVACLPACADNYYCLTGCCVPPVR
jgi:hypothetical protein